MRSRIISFFVKHFPTLVKAAKAMLPRHNPPEKGRIHRILSRLGVSIARKPDGTFGIFFICERNEIDSSIEDARKNSVINPTDHEHITKDSRNM